MPLGRSILALALAPALVLAGCGSQDDTALAEQVAIAKDAADRAVTAQKAAERAASLARQSTPASFAEDEIVEEVDYSVPEESSDASGGDDSSASSTTSPIPR